ncbi:MAG: replicative DNA helicase, partial [Deltaproteobacteria bacterium]|nr:replicative DNA helicase [Deltaproteobacteria bacterium]
MKPQENPFFTKVPPQNIEAEQSVLGAILLENEVLHQVIEILDMSDFYREAHRKIFGSMIELYNKNEPSDLITLTDTLTQKKHLEDVGGPSYLSSLVDNIPTAANAIHYAKIVRERSILRKIINAATEIINKGYENGG